jgi:type I restriction enzyme S subunit
MSEWHVHRLGDNVSPLSGFPFSSSAFSNENGFPLIRIRDLLDGKTELKYSGKFEKSYVIKADDVLIGMDGDFHLVKWKGQEALLNQRILKLIENRQSELCLDFLFYWLAPFLIKVNEQTAATTVKHLSTFDVVNAIVHAPTYQQQQKIAKILSTVDKLIEKTQNLIDKYTSVKQGMMADLFTRGIDLTPGENYGQLRPTVTEAPELYQQNELGWVPKDWEVLPSGDLCDRICVGIVIQPTQYYADYGVPAFRSANVRESGIDPNNFVYISTESNALLAKSQIKTGDVLSVRTGYPGTSAVVPEEFNGSNCIDILISSPNKRVLSEYLCEWINSEFGKGQVLRMQGGIAQQHFNVGDMKMLLVALPSEAEQIKIIASLDSVKNKIKTEEAIIYKYKKQKKGLMQDLLTGKVRV